MTRMIRQKFINRCDLTDNPDMYYLFGDNTIRKGMGGQAGAMRGEPNAIGIATKALPSQQPDSFFSDNFWEENFEIIWGDLALAFDRKFEGYQLVIPSDGLGTGLSELPTRAPFTNALLLRSIELLDTLKTRDEWVEKNKTAKYLISISRQMKYEKKIYNPEKG